MANRRLILLALLAWPAARAFGQSRGALPPVKAADFSPLVAQAPAATRAAMRDLLETVFGGASSRPSVVVAAEPLEGRPAGKRSLEERRIGRGQAARALRNLQDDQPQLALVARLARGLGRPTPKKAFYALRVAQLSAALPDGKILRDPRTAAALARLYRGQAKRRNTPGLLGLVDEAVYRLGACASRRDARRALKSALSKNQVIYRVTDAAILKRLTK